MCDGTDAMYIARGECFAGGVMIHDDVIPRVLSVTCTACARAG